MALKKSQITALLFTIILLFTGCGLLDEDKKDDNTGGGDTPTITFAAGSVSDGKPMGAWKSINDGDNEIIVLTGDTLTIYEYDDMGDSSILWVEKMPFVYSSTNDTLIITEGTDTMKVPFEIVDNTMTVIVPGDDGVPETMSFIIYSNTTLPTEWQYDFILDHAEEVVMSLTGSWIESGDYPMEIITFEPPYLYLYEYDSDLKEVDTTKLDLNWLASKDGIIIPNELAGLDTLTFELYETTLKITDGTEIYTFEKYTGAIPHPDWKVPELSFAAGSVTNGLPIGAWKNSQAGENEIVVLTTETLTIYEYETNDTGAILWINPMPFTFNSTKTGFVVGEGTDTMTVPFLLNGTTMTVIAPDDNGGLDTITFTPYAATTLPSEWEYDEIRYQDEEYHENGLDGQWLDTKRLLSFSFWEDSLHLFLYNPLDSTLVDETFTYSMMEGSVNIYKSGMLVKNVQFYFSNDTLHIPDYDGAAFALTYTSEELPLSEWIVKDSGSTGTNPYMGYWVLAGDTPDEIMMIKDYDINSVIYMSETKQMMPIFMNYDLNSAMDTIYVKIPNSTGTQDTWTSPIYLSNDTLVMTKTPNGERRYVAYMGDIPHDTWDVTEDYKIWGNWWVDNTTKDTIWNFYGSYLTIYAYNPADSSFTEEHFMYDVSAAMDTLYIDDQGIVTEWVMTPGETAITLTNSGETVKLIRGMDQFPPSEWILKDYGHEDRVYPPFIGEWLSSDGSQIVTFGPEIMTAFDFNSGVLTIKSLAYQPNTTGDTLFTKDLAGNQSWVVPSEATAGLQLEFMGGVVQTYMPNTGKIPSDNWTISSGDDYSFTQEPFIGTWRAADATKDAVLKVGATIITIVEFREGVIDTNYMDYKYDAVGNNIMIYEMGNLQAVPITVDEGVSITVTPDQDGPQTFNVYDGEIPPSSWSTAQ